MTIKKTDLTKLIKEELTLFYVTPDAFAKEKKLETPKKKPLQEMSFVVNIADIGNVVVSGGSAGEIKTRLVKKLRGGKKDIVSITRVTQGKADQAAKKLGLDVADVGPEAGPFGEGAINEANPAQIKRMFDKKIQRIEKVANIIKQTLGYITKRYSKQTPSTKSLLFLSSVADKLERVEASLNEFPQDKFDPPSR
jgi:hypothetical protein